MIETPQDSGYNVPTVFGAPISPSQICVYRAGSSKVAALLELVAAVAAHSGVTDHELFRGAVFDREEKRSTGIGAGVAIPHVRTPAIRSAVLGVGVSRDGIDYGAVDNMPVHLVILFATPAEGNDEYLGLLRQVMIALRGTDLYDRLIQCHTREEVAGVLQR